MQTARILIVDDHPLIGTGYRQILRSHPEFEICGQAASEEEAMRMMEQTQPHLAVIDLSLAGGHGLDLIRWAKERFPQVKMLVVSAHDEALFAERAVQSGALGYISKQASGEQLVAGIRAALEGRIYLSEAMTSRLLIRAAGGPSRSLGSPVEGLSDRELTVFEMLGRGMTSRQIAGKLGVSPKTVDRYRENIKAKLGLRNAIELVQRATQWVLESG